MVLIVSRSRPCYPHPMKVCALDSMSTTAKYDPGDRQLLPSLIPTPLRWMTHGTASSAWLPEEGSRSHTALQAAATAALSGNPLRGGGGSHL